MMFQIKVFGLVLLSAAIVQCENDKHKMNLTAPKDMYVVRATVYQIGILTNQTNETELNNLGHQEAITIYRNNGTGIDLSSIPEPLLTNITAENVVGVAPASKEFKPWTTLQHLVTSPHFQGNSSKSIEMETNIKKSKRDTTKRPIEVFKGAAIIPSEAGVQSIALPPLLTFNKNLSNIPVPIPNMSVISYAKVNTLVHSP